MIALLEPPIQAQAAWTLTTADFREEPVTLRAIDEAGIHVLRAAVAQERVVALDNFLDIQRPLGPAQPGGKFVLQLNGGDRLGGEPVSLKGEQLLWNSSAVGPLTISLGRIASITRPGKVAPDDRAKQDVVVLANGDTVRGVVAGLEDGRILIQADADTTPVPLTSITSVTFASTGKSSSADKGFRVRFDDGSSVVADSIALDGERLAMKLGKESPRAIDLARVGAIEQLDGPVSWLSARRPVESIYVPFFGAAQNFPARMNQTVEGIGSAIRFGDRVFAHGIGTHSYSRLSWPLDGKYAAFRVRYAIAGDRPRADVIVRLKLDDRVVYEKPHVRAGELSPVIVEDLAGVKRLTLEVDYGDNLDADDRLNWIEPALLRNKPQEAPSAGEPAAIPATSPEPSPAS